MNNKSGIYKITNPNNKIYIGESINVHHRLKQYKKLYKRIKYQYKIYNSLVKYGVENHIFEIIEFCNINDLKIRERYWQDYYNVLGGKGLNLKLTGVKDKKQVHSKEILKKMSIIKKEQYKSGKITSNWKFVKNRNCSLETKLKISNANKGINNGMYGYKEEYHHKLDRMKNMLSKERWNTGLTKNTDERILKMSHKLKGRKPVNKIKHSLVNNITQEIWKADSLTELGNISPLSISSLTRLKNNSCSKKLKENYKLIY